MSPVDTLMHEHRQIERMLACLEKMAGVFLRKRLLDAESARAALTFIRGYADRCHHGKEEAQLFPALEGHGIAPDCGPTAVMRYEHEQGRAHVREMEASIAASEKGDGEAFARFARAARLYVGLLREHIQKEDHCLFPMVPQILDAKTIGNLGASFDRFDRDEVSEEERSRFLQDLERLEASFPPDRQG